MVRNFNAVLKKLATWDGEDVEDVLPLLEDDLTPLLEETDEEGFPVGLPPDWDVYVREALEPKMGFWPDGLADDIDWWVVDAHGGFITREDDQWLAGSFDEKEYKNQKLGNEVRVWLIKNGLTAREGSERLGVGKRTLDGVAQDRGFRYPQLLRIGMAALSSEAGGVK